MNFNILHRFSGAIIFVAQIECGDDEHYSIKLGLAVKAALAANANLSEANLSWANLSWANLSKANLSWANLSEADLSWANLSWANLSEADLSEANLSEADLSEADLSWANLSWANLSKANLSEADLRHIKHDIWGILLKAIPEVPALRQGVIDGKVDGSTYSGPCACLCGTIANTRGCSPYALEGIQTDSSSMAERFFMGIRKGDTPESNPASKLVLEWVDEFLLLVNRALPVVTEGQALEGGR